MNININVDLLSGIDNTVNIETQNLNLVYKTLDFAYLKFRRYYNTDNRLIFNITGGYQYLTCDEYNNCEFKGIDTYLKINKLVSLTNVIFDIDINVELNNKSNNIIIITNDNVMFNEKHKINIKEINYNTNKSYPFVKLINNNGNLNILSNIIIKVCREFTLVNNRNILICKLPIIECQGGTIFYSEDSAELTEIVDNKSENSDIIIKNGIISGYLYNTKSYNNFKLVDCYNNLIISGIAFNIKYEQKVILFNIRSDNIKNPNKRINIGDLMLIENSYLSSDTNIMLTNIKNITKINTKLININYNKISEKVKKIKDDYILTDEDVKIFHINDTDKIINIKVPNTLKLGTSEIYFRKINEMSRNKIIITIDNCHKNSTGTIILDRTHPEIIIYEDEGIFYTK
jgi:hypothetical protein